MVWGAFQFSGTHTAIATPFTADGLAIDYKSMDALIDFQAANGVQGIVVCGSTGEAAALSDGEYRDVVKFAAEKCRGKLQIVAGIGTNNMQRALEMADFLSGISLDGVLCVTPPYSKPTQAGLIEFFRQVKKALKHPMIAYNVPGRTAVNLLAAATAQLANEGTIAGLKDSTGSIEQLLEIQRLLEKPLPILSGEDMLVSAMMASGASGTISASANIIPKKMAAITAAALNKDFEGAYRAQLSAIPAIRAAFLESNPIPVKSGLWQLGVIAHPTVRVPLMTATDSTQKALKEALGI